MSNYSKATNFAIKDSLLVGDPNKVIKGTELDNEFNAIAGAVSTKANTTSPTFVGTVTAPSIVGALTGTVGATTPNTGAFTTLSTTGAATIGGNTAVTGTLSSTGSATVGGDLAVTGGANFGAVSTSVTPAAGNSTTAIATTAFVQGELTAYAPKSSPTFTGTVTVPTPAAGNNSTAAASTAFVQSTVPTAVTTLLNSTYAPLASPALTGVPTAPTAPLGTNTTQVATTAFVQTQAFNGALPGQLGNAGKFVTTDGTQASWAEVTQYTVLPSQTGNAGRVLTTDGTTATWQSGSSFNYASLLKFS